MLEVTRKASTHLPRVRRTQGVRDTFKALGASVQRVRTIESTDFVGNRGRGRRAPLSRALRPLFIGGFRAMPCRLEGSRAS